MTRIEGTITALITPFSKDGSVIDFEGLSILIERQIKGGVSGLLPLGTTGETPTLTVEEKEAVLKHTIKTVAGRVPVMVGTGTNSTATTIEATLKAQALGADSALIVSPYYNKPSQEGLYQHFKAVSAATSIPIVVYNVAPRTAVNIETKTLQRIAELDSIVAVKEASGNIHQIGKVIDSIQNKHAAFSVLSGDDAMTFPAMALGATGVVSVVSNLVPELVVELVHLVQSGKFEEARQKHYFLIPLFEILFVETNPVPTKRAFELCGLPGGPVRAPLAPLTPESDRALQEVLSRYTLIG